MVSGQGMCEEECDGQRVEPGTLSSSDQIVMMIYPFICETKLQSIPTPSKSARV